MRATHAPAWVADVAPDGALDRRFDDGQASRLEQSVADISESSLEQTYPMLLEHYRSRGDGLAAARVASKLLSLYNRRGYYHEAKSFIDSIIPYFDALVETGQAERMKAVIELNSCLAATGDGARALQVVTDLAVPHITRPLFLANMNYILAMHYLRFAEVKDIDRAERHILQAVENMRAAKGDPEASEHPFLTAFIDNGLAFLRYGRSGIRTHSIFAPRRTDR